MISAVTGLNFAPVAGTIRYLSTERAVSSVALVVFAADQKRLAAVDVALGPCVPKPGKKKALLSPLNQDGCETLEQASALFAALTGQPATDVLELCSEDGPGALYRCSQPFLDAMADYSVRMMAIDDLDEFDREQTRLSEAWMQAVAWPSHYVSLKSRLHRIHLARVARSKGQPLYFWFGPRVSERVVVAGSAPYPGRSRSAADRRC